MPASDTDIHAVYTQGMGTSHATGLRAVWQAAQTELLADLKLAWADVQAARDKTAAAIAKAAPKPAATPAAAVYTAAAAAASTSGTKGKWV